MDTREKINHTIRQLEELYNPENDTSPVAPVSYADRELLDCVKLLQAEIEALQRRVEALESRGIT